MGTGVTAQVLVPGSHVKAANISNSSTVKLDLDGEGEGARWIPGGGARASWLASLAQQQDLRSVRNSLSKNKVRAGEKAQRQRTVAALPEDPDLGLRTHTTAHSHQTPVQRDPAPSSGFCVHQAYMRYTDPDADKTAIHIIYVLCWRPRFSRQHCLVGLELVK